MESQLDKKLTPNMPPTKQEITDDTYNGRFCEASQAKSHEWVKNLGNKLENSKAKIQPLKQRTSRILNRPTAVAKWDKEMISAVASNNIQGGFLAAFKGDF